MKVGILAGGLGTRLAQETSVKPKPMVEIGGYPVLWHIMNIYANAGYKEFMVALGYKGFLIKDYFVNYRKRTQSLSIDLGNGDVDWHGKEELDWKIHLLETGLQTQTGARVRKLAEFAGKEAFMLTYGDGVCNLDVGKLVEFHKSHGKLATITAVRPPARFGNLSLDGPSVTAFKEKPQIGEGWINGGFFILEPGIVDYIDEGEDVIWEQKPLERLAADGQLHAYFHDGFWQCMDTLRDVRLLNQLWQDENPPWKVWT
ncbi:MAG: glucose-1-phosphate cytidylyltransferase [Anaerolineae bacterium]|nr:glucose-1-phosphate cytidylyltransferase [Anaerolineae bacterium]